MKTRCQMFVSLLLGATKKDHSGRALFKAASLKDIFGALKQLREVGFGTAHFETGVSFVRRLRQYL